MSTLAAPPDRPAGADPAVPFGTGPLVGRDWELRALARAVARVGSGGSAVLEVVGDPGVGKTRLLGHLGRLCQAQDLVVLSGAAPVAPQVRPPYQVFIDALDKPLSDLHEGQLSALGPHLAALGRVFPAVSGHRQGSGNGRPDLHRLRVAVRALLELVAPDGLALILDDLHRADRDCVDLLSGLLRRPPLVPILLAVAYRPRQAPARLRLALADATVAHRVERHRLGALNTAESEVVLDGRGTRSWRRMVSELSGGNPFYLHALAATAAEHGAPGGLPAPSPLPAAVAAPLLTELDALSPTARLAAHAAAVAGTAFDPEVVAAVAGLGEADLRRALDELVRGDLIRRVPATRSFAFRHPLVRQVAYENAPAAWRLPAHGRAAQALHRRGASPAARGYHVELAGQAGDVGSVAVLAEAAREVRPAAPALAARWLRTALRLLPDDEPAWATRLQLDLAASLELAGQLREAYDILDRVLDRMPPDRRSRRARAVVACALLERHLGRPVAGRDRLRAELASLPDPGWPGTAMLRVALAGTELLYGDAAACVEPAKRVLAQAARPGAQPLAAAALGILSLAGVFQQEVDTARTYLNDAVSLLDGLTDSQVREHLDAVAWVCLAEPLLERPGEAVRHLDRALALSRSGRNGLLAAQLHLCRAAALHDAGRLAEAGAGAQDALELADRSGSEEQMVAALALRCAIATWTGALDEAVRAGASATDRVDPANPGWVGTLAARTLAEARLARGECDACLGLVELVGGASLRHVDGWSRVAWCELLTRAELAAGRVEAAARWAELAEHDATRLQLSGRRGLALLARAAVEIVTDPVAGLAAAVAAQKALAAAERPLDALRARLAVARALAAQNQTDRAAAELAAVWAAAQACGAHGLAGPGPAERRLPPASPRKNLESVRIGLAALTPRERQAADKVAEGLTNRQIAQLLYVTEKTVEKHLSNIFAKLGVSSRTGVVSAVLRAGGGGIAEPSGPYPQPR